MLNGFGHIVLFASRDMKCSEAACVLLGLLCKMMTLCTQVTIRWHETDLRVRASLTLSAAKDENAMSSMLDVVWDSLEITQVPSCLCPSSCQYTLPCTGSPFECLMSLVYVPWPGCAEPGAAVRQWHGVLAALSACRTLAQT